MYAWVCVNCPAIPCRMASPLVGNDYPLSVMKKNGRLGGILGELGYEKERVWVL